MTPFGLSGLLTGFTSIIFGFFVWLMSPNRKIGRIWFLFTLAVGGWGFGGMWIGWTRNAAEGLLAWQVAYAFGVIWIAPVFYHFVCYFLELDRKRSIIIQYAIVSVFLLSIPTPLFFERARFVFNSFYYGLGGKLYPVYFTWWIGLVVYSHVELLRMYKKVSVSKKNQIKYFFLATAVGYSGGTLAYLPNFGIDVYPWGNFTVCLYPLIMSYAILKHSLMDITVIIRKTLVYSVVTGTLAAGYFGAVTLFARVFQGFSGYQTLFSSAIAAGLITIAFQPLRKKVQAFVDSKFFRQYVDREEKLYELSREVITHTTPEAMAQSLIRVLTDTLHPKAAALYLRARDGDGFVLVSDQVRGNLPDRMPESNPLTNYFLDHPQPFIQQDLRVGNGEPLDTRRPTRKEESI